MLKKKLIDKIIRVRRDLCVNELLIYFIYILHLYIFKKIER